jgi:hypothetical protein
MRTRFVGTSHHADLASASLSADHPAAVEGRTIFPTRVKSPAEVDRVLVSGHNNAKLGAFVETGAWSGMPILTLTLEERATCPRTCHHWQSCFGNAMHMARRHRHGPELIAQLDEELRYYGRQDKDGFVVRLHVLGDFYSVEYVSAWIRWMQNIPQLHVWGYTARQRGTEIGNLLAAMNVAFPHRWRMRFSVPQDAPIAPLQVTTIWRQPEGARVDEGLTCPQSRERLATCGLCGICWQAGKERERIVFTGHGMRSRPKKEAA